MRLSIAPRPGIPARALPDREVRRKARRSVHQERLVQLYRDGTTALAIARASEHQAMTEALQAALAASGADQEKS